ncbi:MAG: hypothetical protein IJZ02_06975 [Clostridia bacterium]|nr:hypothetical protein [Clostridia bacterium]
MRYVTKVFALLLAGMLLLCGCALTDILILPPADTDGPEETGDPVTDGAVQTEADGPAEIEEEHFASAVEEKAAKRIDAAIARAIELLDTFHEEPIAILECDDSARPKQRDLLKDPLSVEIYDTLLRQMSAYGDLHYSEKDSPGLDLFCICVSAVDALRIDRNDLFLYADVKITGSEYTLSYYMPGDGLSSPCDDREAIRREVELCDAVVTRILAKMPEGLTAHQKCAYFAFVLAAGTEYDHREDYPLFDYPAHAALVWGTAVCSGYAQAFTRLCREAGISCWYCRGTVRGPLGDGRHAWAMLDTEDGPIYVDPTWYDVPEISTHYRDGKEQYLFMTQEEFDENGCTVDSRQ